jgi:RNA polymerase-interacting CarD/CdnL/TRCF family regulator
MTFTKNELLEAALSLPPIVRQEFVEHVLESLQDDETNAIEREWLEVAKQRLNDYRAGRMKGRPAAEVFDALRAESNQ